MNSFERMKANEAATSINDFHEVFICDYAAGILRWKYSVGRRIRAGGVAGYITSKGYLQVQLHYRVHRVHRVIWAMRHGAWPQCQIDHIDENKSNNSIGNLRQCTNGENQQNITKARRGSRSGVRGVCWITRDKKWRAHIVINGERKHLGAFDSLLDAVAARRRAEREYFGAFAPNRTEN